MIHKYLYQTKQLYFFNYSLGLKQANISESESMNLRNISGLEFMLGESETTQLKFSLTFFTPIFILRKDTAQKMKFSIKDFFSKYDQILRKLRIKFSLIENYIFCALRDIVEYTLKLVLFSGQVILYLKISTTFDVKQ